MFFINRRERTLDADDSVIGVGARKRSVNVGARARFAFLTGIANDRRGETRGILISSADACQRDIKLFDNINGILNFTSMHATPVCVAERG